MTKRSQFLTSNIEKVALTHREKHSPPKENYKSAEGTSPQKRSLEPLPQKKKIDEKT